MSQKKINKVCDKKHEDWEEKQIQRIKKEREKNLRSLKRKNEYFYL